MKKIIASTVIALSLLASVGGAANAADFGTSFFQQLSQEGS